MLPWLYLGGACGACLIALFLGARALRRDPSPLRAYLGFLLQPWKIATFTVAAVGLAGIAPYTGDPTWDRIDATLMAVLTFLSAPGSVGALYLWTQRRVGLVTAYQAACAWLFSASWCYDLYLVARDGAYPPTAAANLAASSILYCAAGLLWNLEHRPGRGVIFAFMEGPWPAAPAGEFQFREILLYALPFMLLASGLMLLFF